MSEGNIRRLLGLDGPPRPDVCPHLGACRYEARYDSMPVLEIEAGPLVNRRLLAEMIEKATRKIYVRDVCVRCGRTIERS